MKILIPNATGPDNMGDQAILHGLLSCLAEAFPDHKLTILTSSPEQYRGVAAERIDYNLYVWSVFQHANPLFRIWRLLCLGYMYVAHAYGLPIPRTGRLSSLVNEYLRADLIVFAGGGYLRANKGLTQSLNLLMHLFMMRFAAFSKAKQILASASFGPFAHSWQEWLAAKTLSRVDLVCVREEISQKVLTRTMGDRVQLSTDTAFYMRPMAHPRVQRAHPIVGFTIRRWGSQAQQAELIRAYVHALSQFAQEHHAQVQPVIQVDSPRQGENDRRITSLVSSGLEALHIVVHPAVVLRDLPHALRTYSSLDIILGMRMHSNILSHIQGTPFVAVSYEHKTEGICRTLGLAKFSVRLEDVNDIKLLSMLQDRFLHRPSQTSMEADRRVMQSMREDFIRLLKQYAPTSDTNSSLS